ncbi:MAG: Unknown protein [uncultured Sulfurovum sp.]|uniref:Acyltransferase 3 domain-containing protein n=1 Tax=uncultured Sulfurovum sp. TaxID=269237 RepID=A0A6S6TL96_9BACT|nr:MAG: Unknown protein [uncultured Sulfurovum sp.]
MLSRNYHSTNFITGLRAIAVLMVFMIHAGGGGLREMFSFGERFENMGKYGVDIFFVISGFTIFYQFYNKNYSLRNFLILRLLRVSIPYYPIIIVLSLYSFLGGRDYNYWAIKFCDGSIDIVNFFTHIFYISYIDLKYANTIIGVEWTLAIEVFYYFLLGYMIYVLKKLSSIKSVMFYLVLSFILSIGLVFIGKLMTNALFISWMPFKYGYMFLLGGLAYHLREHIHQKYNKAKINNFSNITIIIVTLLFFIFMFATFIPNKTTINQLFFSLLTFLLIVFVDDNSSFSKIFTNKIMIFLGSISFSFYLIHLLILKFRIFVTGIESEFLLFIYFFSIIVLISTIYYYVFEIIIYRKFKNKIKSIIRKKND